MPGIGKIDIAGLLQKSVQSMEQRAKPADCSEKSAVGAGVGTVNAKKGTKVGLNTLPSLY